jgi:hypothetical protein
MKHVLRMSNSIPETDCFRCGKSFVVQPYLVYRKESKYFCCYTCYLAHMKEREEKKLKGKKKEAGNEL